MLTSTMSSSPFSTSCSSSRGFQEDDTGQPETGMPPVTAAAAVEMTSAGTSLRLDLIERTLALMGRLRTTTLIFGGSLLLISAAAADCPPAARF